MTDADKHAAAGTLARLSTSPGIASQSGSQGSTTGGSADHHERRGTAGLDGPGRGHRAVTTVQDTTHALTQGWNGQQLMTQTQAALQITSTAMPVVANVIGMAIGK